MPVIPSTAHSFGTSRKTNMSNRVTSYNRPLFKQVVGSRRSDPKSRAYLLEVYEGAPVNGNSNAATGKIIPQPWVKVRDYHIRKNMIGLPISICDTLLKHLLTCATNEAHLSDNSEDSDTGGLSSSPRVDAQDGSPIRVSGDDKLIEQTTSNEVSNEKSKTRPNVFQLDKLQPVRIVCDATECTLKITDRDPFVKRDEETGQNTQQDASLRWIVSSQPRNSSVNDGQNSETVNANDDAKYSTEAPGCIELYEFLMPHLAAFLADVVTRYCKAEMVSEIRPLYTASGGRKFFFDPRDTKYGKRLQISQVTDMHRNVIGIPVEALVSFRSRLDVIIQNLGLEDRHNLKSTFYKDNVSRTPRAQRPVASMGRQDGLVEGNDDSGNGNDADQDHEHVNRRRFRPARSTNYGGYYYGRRNGGAYGGQYNSNRDGFNGRHYYNNRFRHRSKRNTNANALEQNHKLEKELVNNTA